jgi:hypothetical protein
VTDKVEHIDAVVAAVERQAEGWAVHNHASFDEPVYELTIQDQPLNLVMESLLWQESLKEPLALLGVEQGFATNRAEVAA